MASFQGLKRLTKGINKKLTKSEVDRGYIFITLDKEAKKIVGDRFAIKIEGKSFGGKKLDSYGRVSVGKEVTKSLAKKNILVTLKGSRLIIK